MFKITIPDDAVKQKYYNALFVTSESVTPTPDASGSIVNYKMGSLVILEVEKSAIEKAKDDLNKIKNNRGFFAKLFESFRENIIICLAILILLIILIVYLIMKEFRKRKKDGVKFEEKDVWLSHEKSKHP